MDPSRNDSSPGLFFVLRGAAGGLLMGLANLVPGISGGTMLLAAGVYPDFIRGIAEVSTFRMRPRSLVLLAAVVGAAVVAIGAGAGVVKGLVVDHRWVMYSLFIGLTLGGVPVLWRLLRPVDSRVVVAATAGIVAMVALALVQAGAAPRAGGGDRQEMLMLLLAGIAGGSAMILPGVSGGYLLLVLGQYVVILGAIDSASAAVKAHDWAQLAACMKVIVPVGVGVVIGVVGVSNLIRILLDRFPRATMGVLLGLLLGAVAGLWPFQGPAGDQPPGGGELPVAFFAPAGWQIAAAAGLIVAGFAASMAVARLGDRGETTEATQ